MLKTILITGSGGFIGQNLKEYLKDKYFLLCPRSFELNLLDEFAVKKYFNQNNIDFVFHCAAYGARITSDATIQEVGYKNILMFNNLAKSLDSKQFMINLGSGAEYDKTQNLNKIKESDFGVFIPNDPYGYSKYFISKEIEKYNNILNLRLFGVYGKLENPTRFTTYAITQNLKHEPIIINKNTVFDYLYIDDLCKIIEYFIKNRPSEKIINTTPTKSISLFQISEIINQISDFKSEIIIKEKVLNNEYTGDNQRLLKEILKLNFSSYQYGLKNLFDWFNK